eukprot:726463-Pyramimonas_sp.AAC.1
MVGHVAALLGHGELDVRRAHRVQQEVPEALAADRESTGLLRPDAEDVEDDEEVVGAPPRQTVEVHPIQCRLSLPPLQAGPNRSARLCAK